jgi:hypothetical protein
VYVYTHILRSDYCPTIEVDGFEVISLQICEKFPNICINPRTFLIVKLLPYTQSRPEFPGRGLGESGIGGKGML